MIASQKENFVN